MRNVMWATWFMCLVMLTPWVPSLKNADGPTVNLWVTSGDQRMLLQPQPPLTFAPQSAPAPYTITVNDAQTYQQIAGFGASLTDASAWLLTATLTATQRTKVLMDLFDPLQGLGLSILRQPMGASDFALSDYTYDDVPPGQTDPTLAHFSIAHDLPYIVPLLQQIRHINPNLKIIGTPWSPPAWMKTDGSLIGGTLGITSSAPWAHYFVKYVQAYSALGLPIFAVTPQNEPSVTFSIQLHFPGMLLSASQEAQLIAGYLGPAFATAKLNTKILAYDSQWSTPTYPITILNTLAAQPYIAGTAFHCYSGTPAAQSIIHSDFPGKDIYETECSNMYLTSTSFAGALAFDMDKWIIGGLRNWATAVIKWNVALDQNDGPHIGGCPDCTGVVTINTQTGAVSYNEDYYALGQVSKFVVPGAYRIDSNSYGNGSVEDVAFRNPDGSLALIVYNGAPAATSFKVLWNGEAFTYSLPPNAVATFTWTGAAHARAGWNR